MKAISQFIAIFAFVLITIEGTQSKIHKFVAPFETCVGKISCLPGEFCESNSGICMPQLELNGYCSTADNNPCKAMDSSCLPIGNNEYTTCQCNSDYIQDGRVCTLKCKINMDCKDEMKFCNIDGACMNKIALNQSCLIQEEGQCLTANSDCLNDRCQCAQDFGDRNGTSCDPICSDSSNCNNDNHYCDNKGTGLCWEKVGISQECHYPDQCSSFSKAECREDGNRNISRCLCKQDTFFDTGFGYCQEKCTSTDLCRDTEYCEDSSGRCKIKMGLNNLCTENIQCLTNAAFCKESELFPGSKFCKCLDDFIEERNMCLEKCTKSSGCDFNAEFCEVETGRCRSKGFLHFQCTEEGSEQCTGDLMTCSTVSEDLQACSCVENSIESIDDKRCLSLATALGEDCEEPQQCSSPSFVGNEDQTANVTDCVGKKCDCATSIIKSEGKCYIQKLLGNSCKQDKECSLSITGSQCDPKTNTCVCNAGLQGVDGSKACNKPSSGFLIKVNSFLRVLVSLVLFAPQI